MAAENLDCLIVGGGPAGLMSAVYLGRFKRRTVVIDEGHSRVGMIPKSRNVIGFPDGVEGPELLQRMRLHAQKYAPVEIGRVESLSRGVDGVFEAFAGSAVFRAPYVILATGARDIEPDIPGLRESLKTGHVRYCPVCDGFETQGQRVAVLGRDAHGLRESAFVASFGNEATWLSLGTHAHCGDEEMQRLRDAGVQVVGEMPRHIHCEPERGIEVELPDGQRMRFDVLYPALGMHHVSELAAGVGAQVQDNGQLVVDDHFETTVPGLYAAGDVAGGLNQINVAAGHAAVVATAIHNRLL